FSCLLPSFLASPLSFLRPGHHCAKLCPHPLDLVLTVDLAQALEVGAGPALSQPLSSERSISHVIQDFLHGGSGLVGDDLRAARVVAILGGVADGVAHELEPAPVHKVNDELELMEALEVRHLRPVAGSSQGLEA